MITNDYKKFFYNTKETLVESAPPHFAVAKWHAELTQGQSSCDDLTNVANQQLPLLKLSKV